MNNGVVYVIAFTRMQRDQVWQNFAALAKFKKTLAIFGGWFTILKYVPSTWAKF